MVVPFEKPKKPITISCDVAAQMKEEIKNFCLATRDVKNAKERGEHPTPEQALDLCNRENGRNTALLNLAKLVLEHIIEPHFNYPL